MSDQIKHECGIALVRLLKPLAYYDAKYGTPLYGLNKMLLLMQKQHNRGQDGAGIACVKTNMPAGTKYMHRYRTTKPQPVKDIIKHIDGELKAFKKNNLNDPAFLKEHAPFIGEILMGHLRYGTHGGNDIQYCHPVARKNNWPNRTLLLAGNFNMTNVEELFGHLVNLGQHPKAKSDTVTVLEKIGHFLDLEVTSLYEMYNTDDDELSKIEIATQINNNINMQRVISRAARKFDGGYVMSGVLGCGISFVMRDPNGIRPAYWYADGEAIVVASERPAIMTAFNVSYANVQELLPGHILTIKLDGTHTIEPFADQRPKTACSFERIYFSRGTDRDIYTERKQLGRILVPQVLQTVNNDFANTVFSFVPNTAEAAFYGLMKGAEEQLNQIKQQKILELGSNITPETLAPIINMRARLEKIAVKDDKLRTFITEDASRSELVSHVYDVTYGIVRDHKDTLVLLDDSIVRGTTLRESIIKIVARLKPKKIVIVSSAPQIRYPDCYGIDMSRMGEFVAFQAMIQLLTERGQEHLLQETYQKCKRQVELPQPDTNEVKALYDRFTDDEISQKIAQIITPEGIEPAIHVIYQTLEGLHQACPHHKGDWYFSGNYPTPGGNRVVNRAFMYYVEGKNNRAY
jgi:amidophosphoribosyltransferase